MHTQQLRCAKMFSRTELNYPQELPILLGGVGWGEEVQTHNSLCQLKESASG